MRQVGGEPILLEQALTQAGISTTRYRDADEAERLARASFVGFRQGIARTHKFAGEASKA